MKYGAITPTDAKVLEDGIVLSKTESGIRFLEVGTYDGETSIGIVGFCAENGIPIELVGVDLRERPPLFPLGATFFSAPSTPVPEGVSRVFDMVFIDACHCVYHAATDISSYAPMIRVGGCLLLHDTAPHLQHVLHSSLIHPDREPFKTGVLDALDVIGFPWDGWELLRDEHDVRFDIGGVRLYRRNQ